MFLKKVTKRSAAHRENHMKYFNNVSEKILSDFNSHRVTGRR